MAIDFEKNRRTMVDCQIRTADVTQASLLSAFLEVPREVFAPSALSALAYVDAPLRLDGARYLMPPAALARLLQLTQIGEGDLVLDIGCATGYSAAIISRICDSVVALECDRDLATQAEAALSRLEYDNAVVVQGDLAKGYEGEGPYDAIMLEGAIETVPHDLLGQLKPGGRLVAVVGRGNAAMANVWHNEGGNISSLPAFNCAVPLLPGFASRPQFVF